MTSNSILIWISPKDFKVKSIFITESFNESEFYPIFAKYKKALFDDSKNSNRIFINSRLSDVSIFICSTMAKNRF